MRARESDPLRPLRQERHGGSFADVAQWLRSHRGPRMRRSAPWPAFAAALTVIVVIGGWSMPVSRDEVIGVAAELIATTPAALDAIRARAEGRGLLLVHLEPRAGRVLAAVSVAEADSLRAWIRDAGLEATRLGPIHARVSRRLGSVAASRIRGVRLPAGDRVELYRSAVALADSLAPGAIIAVHGSTGLGVLAATAGSVEVMPAPDAEVELLLIRRSTGDSLHVRVNAAQYVAADDSVRERLLRQALLASGVTHVTVTVRGGAVHIQPMPSTHRPRGTRKSGSS